MRAGCREKSERRFAADTGSAEVCGSPMGEAALQGLLSERTFPRFAEEVAREVRDSGAVEVLYGLITERAEALPRAVRHRILFRGAYVLERIFFETPELFEPCIDRFCSRDFPACSDESMKRHFGKIMARLLLDYRPEEAVLERIAEAAARWAVEHRAKVAVRVWAVEVLLCCRGRVAWLTEIGDELLAAVGRDASPGIAVRMRKRWRMAFGGESR
nr:hypothetical protein [uncultured Alistipes sp.]